MRAATLIRSGSLQSQSQRIFGSPRGSEDSIGGGGGRISFLRRNRSINFAPRSSAAVHLDVKARKEAPISRDSLRRARSEADLIVSDRPSRIAAKSSSPPVVEKEEEVELSGGGMGKGRKTGGRGEGGDRGENKGIGDYYQEMLRADPGNPLLLRNYGKFLHEVEGDVKRAEECYGRAILANPGDGDVLSLYGNLVWETDKDEERAGSYFERAVEAAPDDCYVLGSYAHFLWDTEDDGDEEKEGRKPSTSSSPLPLVEAF